MKRFVQKALCLLLSFPFVFFYPAVLADPKDISFPWHTFAAQNNFSYVYMETAELPGGMFYDVNFTKFITIFGVHAISTANVTDETLIHVAKVLAKYIDNDEDGKPDDETSLTLLQHAHVVMGYFKDKKEARKFKKQLADDVNGEQFRLASNSCMYFVEQLASDVSIEYHNVRKALRRRNILSKVMNCSSFANIKFDRSLWYSLYIYLYYGRIDTFSESIISRLRDVTQKAKSMQLYKPLYGYTDNMQISEFLTWTILTYLNAFECHCEEKDFKEWWKLCLKEDLEVIDPNLLDILQNLIHAPTILPDGEYNGAIAFTNNV